MSLPEPETNGHGAAQGARVALERGNVENAIEHLAGGLAWASDMLVLLDERVTALEAGREPPPVDFNVPE